MPNTYLSIGRPLPCRVNIVLSTSLNEVNKEKEEKDIHVFKTIEECINFCNNKNFDEVWVIGGESIYRQFLDLNYIQKIYKTNINKKIECDTFFPYISNKFYLEETIILDSFAILSGNTSSFPKILPAGNLEVPVVFRTLPISNSSGFCCT